MNRIEQDELMLWKLSENKELIERLEIGDLDSFTQLFIIESIMED